MTEGWVSPGQPDRVSSVRVELRGEHAHLSVFFRGKLSGVLVVGRGEVMVMLAILLRRDEAPRERRVRDETIPPPAEWEEETE